MKFSNQPSTVAAASPGINSYGVPAQVSEAADLNNGLRKLGFYFALAVAFLRYSLLHEVMSYYSGFDTKILYLFSIPAFFCCVGSGGFQRVFSARTAKYWIGFIAWLFISVPFSTWKGESTSYALTYCRVDLPMLIFLGGFAMTWKEIRTILYTIAVAGITSVSFAKFFGFSLYGRSGLSFGTMANPDDYAGVLILTLPFIMFMVLRPMNVLFPLQKLIQVAGLIAIAYGLYLIMASGSRGALVAVVACAIFAFVKARGAVRVALVIALPLATGCLVAVLPPTIVTRLMTFTPNAENAADGEAAASSNMRRILLIASIKDTLTHPLFGVGTGQFPNYEGRQKTHDQGGFTGAHNSYTEISSEMGFPGVFFYVGGIISSFLVLQRTWKQTAKVPQAKEIRTACFCVSISFLGFCVAIGFLNFAYFFYLPGFTGLIIALSAAVNREMKLLSAIPEEPQQPAFSVFTGRRPAPAWAVDPSKPVSPPDRVRFNGYR